MKFIISRTSNWSDEESPCCEAVREPHVRIDERTVDNPDKLNQGPEYWYKLGQNHRVENGHIKRDFPYEAWSIEISSLEELLEFTKRYGRVIINEYCGNPTLNEIEIYDGYRE